MAHVIGIPLLKGNSEIILAGHMRNALQTDAFEGMAVGFSGSNSVEPNLVKLDDPDSNGFYGFIFDINKCSYRCSIVRAGESIPLPRAAAALTGGAQVLVNSTTGLIDPAGDIETNSFVVNNGAGSLQVVSGKTGEAAANACLIAMGSLLGGAVTPATATAAATSTSKSKSKTA